MSGWIKLDSEALKRPQSARIGTTDAIVYLSPYDIPEAVRGFYSQEIDRFVFEFRYLGGPDGPQEALDRAQISEKVVAMLGCNSHRLYRLEIDVKAMGLEVRGLKSRMTEVLDEGIRSLDKSRKRPSNRGRYEIVEQAIESCEAELMDDLVQSTP